MFVLFVFVVAVVVHVFVCFVVVSFVFLLFLVFLFLSYLLHVPCCLTAHSRIQPPRIEFAGCFILFFVCL